ncbi:sensor histidine kinase [Krasilnikoviella flava]|uniref:histidine kinase n=1 Tax=Krasilnikoviella flava TaxID=526729 RepID=A0A1T5IEN4_9MICO|nr:HAMP domain-containing sensor histidine kinase [Krasilnikoviella flava]SKC37651.1 Signal transduction histidine kinase [Krasilnikoviella flava]
MTGMFDGMLDAGDVGLIVLTTTACTAVVTGLALAVLRWNRRGPVASQVAVVVAAAVASIVASVVAVMVEMFISAHDLVVLSTVIVVSTVMSLAAAWLTTARAVRRSVGTLTRSAQRIADGGVVAPTAAGWREFDDLHTQLVDTSERLAATRLEIDKLDAARRQFFAWISHDLRTPLAGIRAMTEALDDDVAPDRDAYVRTIRAKVDTVTALVDDLFELSTLQSGTLRLERELVVLLDLVSDAVVDVRAAATRRGVRIVQSGVEGHLLWADPRELTRAIGNLLANAVRHAPAGTDILVSAHTRDDDHLVISVLDHGSGVDVTDLGHLFDVGWRANDARTTEPPPDTGPDAGPSTGHGAGLGLAIVRGIVEAHGGEVAAAHVPDGFELAVMLPRGRAPAAARS